MISEGILSVPWIALTNANVGRCWCTDISRVPGMKTFESLLEPRAQLVKKCRETSKDSVAATRWSLDHA